MLRGINPTDLSLEPSKGVKEMAKLQSQKDLMFTALTAAPGQYDLNVWL